VTTRTWEKDGQTVHVNVGNDGIVQAHIDVIAGLLTEAGWTEPTPEPGNKPTPSKPELLTADEQKAITLTADLWNQLCRVVGGGRTRDADLVELCTHIHAIQHAVMSQAAARAYPGEYRLLGGSL